MGCRILCYREVQISKPPTGRTDLIFVEDNPNWMFPKIGGKPQNGWFIRENPMKKWDDLGVPLFLETPNWFQSFWGLLYVILCPPVG